MPMKCMAHTPLPRDRLPVTSAARRSMRLLLRAAWPAICKPMADEKLATSTDRMTSDGV
jgi:hypothetical protein